MKVHLILIFRLRDLQYMWMKCTLQRAFNILDNALKYRKRDVPPELMIRTRNEGNKIIISIEDNGIGMKRRMLKKYSRDSIVYIQATGTM